MTRQKPHISICVCTFRRPRLLEQLVRSLETLRTDDFFTYSAVIVDNDPDRSGEPVIASLQQTVRLRTEYHHEPRRSISYARNRCVQEATGEYLAFIDDDEFPEGDWLFRMFLALKDSHAAGVLGPVRPFFEKGTPKWLPASGLLDRKSFRTGEIIPSATDTRTGNVLFFRCLFEAPGAQFDPKYGLSGGGDAEFFGRMMAKGMTFIWCNEGVVYEHVPPERQRIDYYLRRAFTRGMTSGWEAPFFSQGTLKSLIAVPFYLISLPLFLAVGQHLFVRYLVKCCDHLGKLLYYLGIEVVNERPYQPAKTVSTNQ